MEKEFYICKHCGNIITKIKDGKVPVICCGEKMDKLIPGTSDASVEKHVPVYTITDNHVNVTIGEIEHPMSKEHYIEWIYIKTNKGEQIKYLKPFEKPQVIFYISSDETIENIYAYCNLHSLWKS